MKKLALSLILSAATLASASAAEVTFTFGNKTKSYTISAANAQRLQAWAADAYGAIPNPACNQPSPPVPCAPTIANPEPLLSMIDGLWAGVRNNVISFELEKARKEVPEPGDLR